MQVRGRVTRVDDARTVETSHGDARAAEIGVQTRDGPTTLTLWEKWAETTDYLSAGMEVVCTAVRDQGSGDHTDYATSAASFVVVEPDFLVDVTALRSWVQCPRMYYLNKLSGVPLAEPVTKGTVIHEIFGDMLRGRERATVMEQRVTEASLELDLLGVDREGFIAEVDDHTDAIERWLGQGALDSEDVWRSEQTLLSPLFGLKGRADAVRRGIPVELKTGKNQNREPRFHDKVQAVCYALILGERQAPSRDSIAEHAPDTGTLLYTKNAHLDRSEASGDLSPAKDFSIGKGLLEYVVRERNALAAMEYDHSVPTGYEADAICEYCFELDTCRAISGRLDQESKAGQVGTALPAEAIDYFDTWYDRIEDERTAVHGEYRKLWEQTPAERAADDRALLNLVPDGQVQTADGGWQLEAIRPKPTATTLRPGDTVLVSDGDPISGRTELGRIEALSAERVIVTTDEPVPLKRVDVYPSELSVDRKLTALHDVLLRGSARQRDILTGQADPQFTASEETFSGVNPDQEAAIRRALAAQDVALVHGPPGTGKTYTIAKIVETLVQKGDQVLLTAFTNRAVDNALAAVRDTSLTDEDLVRVGTRSGIGPAAQSLRLRTSEEGAADRLTSAPVIATTTASCGSRIMREQSVDVAVVDEASQLTEPDTLAAIARADRFILVGDHQQLPPVVRTEGLASSLFERLIEENPATAVRLEHQYRMGQRIQAFPSREFYDGALRPATSEIAKRRPGDIADDGSLPAALRDPVSFHHVSGTAEAHTDSKEADRVAELVSWYVTAGVAPSRISIITPFRAQVAEIRRHVHPDATVDTVDRFQGSSQSVVIVSFVATGELEGPIFEDHRRLNVALTRAEYALALVGDREALAGHALYRRMLEWAED